MVKEEMVREVKEEMVVLGVILEIQSVESQV